MEDIWECVLGRPDMWAENAGYVGWSAGYETVS